MNNGYDGGEKRTLLMETGLLCKVAYRKGICIWTFMRIQGVIWQVLT